MPVPRNGQNQSQTVPDYGQTPLFSPEDQSLWKRYSPNHEFPLSLATSVVLHIFVAVVVAIAGVWLFSVSGGSPPDLGAITMGGGGGSGENIGAPEAAPGPQEPVLVDPDALPRDAKPVIVDPNTITLPSDKARLDEMQNEFDKLSKGEARPGVAGNPGKGGPGGGGGDGPGWGPGTGPGFGPGRGDDARTRRKERWEIVLPMSDSAQFARKLAELQAIVMIPNGTNHFLLFDMTKKNPEGKPATIIDLTRMNRIWYTNRMDVVCQGIADELGLSQRPSFFAIFIPQDLETEMAKKELAYANLTEAEIIKRKLNTSFDVSRGSGGWQVRVRSQKPRED